MVVDNMRKQREGSTDGKTMELSSLLYYANVRRTLWKCMENIIQMYGYYYRNVWRISHKSMEIIMGIYGEYHTKVWILSCKCMVNIKEMYGGNKEKRGE